MINRTGCTGFQEVVGVQQPKGILDRVLQFMGIQEVSDDPHEGDPIAQSIVSPVQRNQVAATSERLTNADRRKGRLVSLPGPSRTSTQLKVAVMKPNAYEEVEQIADHLKEKQPVIISLEGLDHATSRRIIDFVSGAVYALDGGIQRVGEEIFLAAPNNVSIDAELARSWNEGELFT